VRLDCDTFPSASAGTIGPPDKVVTYLRIFVNGTDYRIPLYGT
jgi:hypothetical protein